MTNELIAKALESADETRDIEFGFNVLEETGPLFKRLFPGMKAIVVADDNTFAAAGQPAVDSLRAAGVEMAEPFIFPGTPTLHSDYKHVDTLREHIRPLENTIVCSVASGTLNDIAKLASHELDREYMNVCTAASVDGYCSFGAPIAIDGFKITRNCPAPAGAVADLQVMADAPQRLTATGYGDLIEKIPAGADWILADELGIEAIDPYVWGLVQGTLMHALENPEVIATGDPHAIEGLAEGNIMSGLAMQAAKSSRPASGAGHQFSHLWEMEGHGQEWEPPLSHGFKVGIGTIASCALWQYAIENLDLEHLDVEAIVANATPDDVVEQQVNDALIPIIAAEAVKHSVGKNLHGEELRNRLLTIQQAWPAIKERASKQLLAPEDIAARLKAVGAPYHPELIEIDQDRLHESYFKARMIRPRYTIFDVLWDTQTFTQAVDALFEPDGFWGRHATADTI